MLPAEVIRKIRRIEIRTKRLVTDVFAGNYKSTFKGKGMEFFEVREYYPGDDIRNIDWNVTARMGTPYVKKFAEERELTVMILFDASASNDFGTKNRIKREIGAEIGSVLLFCTLRNNDRAGLIIFTDKVEMFVPPRKGISHVLRSIREFVYFQPNGKKTDLKQALEFFSSIARKRAILFVISDFMTTGYEKTMQVLNKKHDVIAIRVLDPREFELVPVGIVEVEDPETGEIAFVDTYDVEFRKSFVEQTMKRFEEQEDFFRKSGIDFIDIRTDKPYINPLIKFFAMRAKRMR